MNRTLEWPVMPDPDMAATGDGRVVAAAINALTLEINALRAVLTATEEARREG